MMRTWAIIEQSSSLYPNGRIVTTAYGRQAAAKAAAGRWAIMPLDDVPTDLQAAYFTWNQEARDASNR